MSKHEHKDCSRLLSSLSGYIDGAVSKEICDEIERHVSDCEDCRIVIDTLKKTIYLYHETAESPVMPDEVRSRLFKRLDLDDFITQANG
jgi:predicted anti-sigma-YlaC factor YlaD